MDITLYLSIGNTIGCVLCSIEAKYIVLGIILFTKVGLILKKTAPAQTGARSLKPPTEETMPQDPKRS